MILEVFKNYCISRKNIKSVMKINKNDSFDLRSQLQQTIISSLMQLPKWTPPNVTLTKILI